MKDQSLATRAIRGMFWTGSSVGIQLIVTFIFYRYLPLEEMGQFQWALTIVVLIALVSALGFNEALVQFQDAGEDHFSTAFWASLALGGVLTGIAILSAPVVSQWAEDPAAFKDALVPLAWLIPFASVSGVVRAKLARDLRFREIALSEILAVLAASAVGLAALWAGKGIWSPILNAVSREAVMLAGLWWASSWRPRLRFQMSSLKALLPFGLNVTGANGLNYVTNNLDKLFIFYFLGDRALGAYAFAYRFTMMPLARGAMIITRVSFPAFSKIQDDNSMLKRGYLKSVEGIALLSWPALMGLLLYAPEVLAWVKGEEMMAALDALRLLILAGALKAIGTVVGSIFLAKGKANWAFWWTLCNLAVMLPGLYVGIEFDVTGVAFVVSIVTVLFLAVSQLLVNRLIGLRMLAFIQELLRPLGVSVLVLAVLTLAKGYLAGSPGVILFSAVLVGLIAFALGLRVLAWEFLLSLWRDLRGGDDGRESFADSR